MLLVNIHCKYITNNERIICVQGTKYSIPDRNRNELLSVK